MWLKSCNDLIYPIIFSVSLIFNFSLQILNFPLVLVIPLDLIKPQFKQFLLLCKLLRNQISWQVSNPSNRLLRSLMVMGIGNTEGKAVVRGRRSKYYHEIGPLPWSVAINCVVEHIN